MKRSKKITVFVSPDNSPAVQRLLSPKPAGSYLEIHAWFMFQNVLDYLESLATRAYFIVYGARGSLAGGVAAFFGRQFPQAVRAARWHLLIAGLTMLLGIAAGFFLSLGNEDWVYTLRPDAVADGRSPTSTTEKFRSVLYRSGQGASDLLANFAALN